MRLALDFQIRQHCLIVRTPVDDAVPAIDQSFVVKTNESFTHGARKIVVHGESKARPVNRCAFTAQLIQNLSAVFLLPLPNPLDKFLAAQIMAALSFFFQRPRYHQLG